MEFRFEDILKNIIPGFFVTLSVIFYLLYPLSHSEFQNFMLTYIKDYTSILIFIILSCTYLCGYLVDALSSWGEHYIIYKALGTPAFKLLSQTSNRITFNLSSSVVRNLDHNFNIYDKKIVSADSKGFTKKQASELFKLANIFSEKSSDDLTKQKLKEYYYSYIFSRNIFFSIFK